MNQFPLFQCILELVNRSSLAGLMSRCIVLPVPYIRFGGTVLVQFNTINLPLISLPFVHVIIAFYIYRSFGTLLPIDPCIIL